MKQRIDKFGNLTIPLFDIYDKQCEDKFIYFYLGLDREIKKIIENAFYKCYTKQLINKENPDIIHRKENGITHIEVHPKDILENIEIIKKVLSSEIHEEDENE
tara:strand:+ start:154 stop:462 length:309 start_codon:yes stop_codon:yes gene_type:complete